MQQVNIMKTSRTFLIAAAVLMSLVSAAAPSPSDFELDEGEVPVYYDSEGSFCFVNLPQAKNDALRHALRTCSAVRFSLDYSNSTSVILQRSDARVAALLQELATVSQWLDWRVGKDVDLECGVPIEFTLLDSEGKVMWTSDGYDLYFQPTPNASPKCILSCFAPMVPFMREYYLPLHL